MLMESIEATDVLPSLIERATNATVRAREAQQAVVDARAYLDLLVRYRSAKPELHRAAATIRAWRLRSRWLAATALTLQERANQVGLERAFLPFPDVDAWRRELGHLHLVHLQPRMPTPPPPQMRTLGRIARRRSLHASARPGASKGRLPPA